MPENVTVLVASRVVFKSKCCITLATDAEIVRVFGKPLIGGYSCVSNRMAFDTDLFSDR